MPDHCAAPGCRSGYDGPCGNKLSFHKFPDNPILKEKWIKAIPRDTSNWLPTKHSRVCGLHFQEDDYVDSRDSHVERRKKKTTTRKSLKKSAIPSVFPNLPTYLSTTPTATRSTAATSSSRLEKEQETLQTEIASFFAAEKCQSLEDLKEKVGNVNLPDGVDTVVKDNKVCFFAMSTKREDPLHLVYSLSVFDDLSFDMTVLEEKVPMKKVYHLLESGQLTLTSISNILALLKNVAEAKSTMEFLPDYVNRCCERMINLAENDSELSKKIGFLSEQLQLAMRSKVHRRYSKDLLACSVMWENTSPSLYKQMVSEGFLTLPSVRRMHQLSNALITETGLQPSSIAYLQARFQKLTDWERLIVLMVDEIYAAQRMEYASGRLTGMDKGALSKTLLSFMIKSVAGQYSDMVAMCPTKNLEADKLAKETMKVLGSLRDLGFKVLVLSLDNATPYRKFLLQLCGGTLKPSIPNPEDPDSPLFLTFDAVHNFKNIYNNFNNKKVFLYPSFEDKNKILCAKFSHVEDLYHLELGKPAKIAYKLNDKVLHPTTIEKTNVQLAGSFFHETTIDGLEFYAETHPGWKETASFLKIVRNWWNRVNVKSPLLGQKKRDKTRVPITSTSDDSFDFLADFSTWLLH